MLNQPSNISPDEVNGTGTVDLSQDVVFSWQVSGDSPMTAYRISFYENDANSTFIFNTGKITLNDPFWGVNYKGEAQIFSMTIHAASFSTYNMTNGNDYKFIITQYWGNGANDYVVQTTASLISGRSTPTVSITAIPNPLTTRSYSITGTYTQAQGDPLAYARWQIALASDKTNPFLDTGKIRGTGELQVDYDGFFTNTTYSVKLTVETVMGVTATTGWVDFAVSYAVTTPQGQVQACQMANDTGVYVHWDQVPTAAGYSVYRRESGGSVLKKIADVDATTGQINDYSAQSGHEYVYYIFPKDAQYFLTEPMVSDPAPVQYWVWSILEAELDATGVYQIVKNYQFRMGMGGVREGQFSNNNAPQLLKNFTRYPTRQPETSNYLSGSVSGFIGTVDWDNGGYLDTISQSEALFALSTTANALFLLDPKGHFLRIHTSTAISLSVETRKVPLPQTMTIAWAEIGSTDGVSIIAAPGGEYYPSDAVVSTKLYINPKTGALIWEREPDYAGGSVIKLDQTTGTLKQTASGAFTVAQMTLTQTTGIVTAEV